MVERRGRDLSGAWIYLCFPCAAICSGESTLKNHLSGKKHKIKLSVKTIWPAQIFETHPYVMNEKNSTVTPASEIVLSKIAQTVNTYTKSGLELDDKYAELRKAECQLQSTLDKIKIPLLGLEYLIEHPPIEDHHEPSYFCTLCSKQGHPRTIINHLTSYWHKKTFIARHFPKAGLRLAPYRSNTNKYREGVSLILNRLGQKIEKTFGRMKPIQIDKHLFDKERDSISQWIFKGRHTVEKEGFTLEEVVDVNLIESLAVKEDVKEAQSDRIDKPANKREPSPPKVAAPTKPKYGYADQKGNRRQNRRSKSLESISDNSEDLNNVKALVSKYRIDRRVNIDRNKISQFSNQYNPKPFERPAPQNAIKSRPANYQYKIKLCEDQRKQAEESAMKTQKYHEKNPEKHPLYPEEWKKYWNKRYKEIQAEGKDPLKYDFKPEWSTYWMKKMKELHEEELRMNILEIYRRMCVTPPDLRRFSPDTRRSPGESRRPSDSWRNDRGFPDGRRSPNSRRSPRRSPIRSPNYRRSPNPRRRSPDPRGRSPDPRRRSPEPRIRSPDMHRPTDLRRVLDSRRRSRSPYSRLRSLEPKRMSPGRTYRSPERRRSPERWSPSKRRYSPERLRSPASSHRSLNKYNRDDRVPEYRPTPPKRKSLARSRSPMQRMGVHSPLSRRESEARNRSPRAPVPAFQTVTISDDELKPEGSASPWNSGDSLGSLPEVGARDATHGPENVVATLRLLVALEDYLGSIGPKIVDLLTEALKMEKERANSSEDMLVRESAVVLIETAKEKLKGAAQAGLVASSAAGAVRAAIVRAAATLHEADKRTTKLKQASGGGGGGAGAGVAGGVRIAGVGSVERAQIAQQMAAALIAEGKTDISAEELEQLVDAVVGMAEAKKREETKKEAAIEHREGKGVRGAETGSSALQLLQSAYDENDKRAEKNEASDAMDGLSDSDLETLLKNFNELSAEEQHSLIAYLKKLEAREPQRVERLRRYVSAEPVKSKASPAAPAPAAPTAPHTVTIESDDDDYTVEEVVKTVTQKAKEDKIRQEMEIVKKSIEGSKPSSEAMTVGKLLPNLELLNKSSAADLLALVQASIGFSSVNNSTPMYRGFH